MRFWLICMVLLFTAGCSSSKMAINSWPYKGNNELYGILEKRDDSYFLNRITNDSASTHLRINNGMPLENTNTYKCEFSYTLLVKGPGEYCKFSTDNFFRKYKISTAHTAIMTIATAGINAVAGGTYGESIFDTEEYNHAIDGLFERSKIDILNLISLNDTAMAYMPDSVTKSTVDKKAEENRLNKTLDETKLELRINDSTGVYKNDLQGHLAVISKIKLNSTQQLPKLLLDKTVDIKVGQDDVEKYYKSKFQEFEKNAAEHKDATHQATTKYESDIMSEIETIKKADHVQRFRVKLESDKYKFKMTNPDVLHLDFSQRNNYPVSVLVESVHFDATPYITYSNKNEHVEVRIENGKIILENNTDMYITINSLDLNLNRKYSNIKNDIKLTPKTTATINVIHPLYDKWVNKYDIQNDVFSVGISMAYTIVDLGKERTLKLKAVTYRVADLINK